MTGRCHRDFYCDVGNRMAKMFYRHFGINFQMGYELKQFRVPGHGEWDADMEVFPEFKFNMWRNSIFLIRIIVLKIF